MFSVADSGARRGLQSRNVHCVGNRDRGVARPTAVQEVPCLPSALHEMENLFAGKLSALIGCGDVDQEEFAGSTESGEPPVPSAPPCDPVNAAPGRNFELKNHPRFVLF